MNLNLIEMKKEIVLLSLALALSAAIFTSCTAESSDYKTNYEVYYKADTTGTVIPASSKGYRAIKKHIDSLARQMQYTVQAVWYESASASKYTAAEATDKMDSDAKTKFVTYSKVFGKNIVKLDSTLRASVQNNAASLTGETAKFVYNATYYLVKFNAADSVIHVAQTSYTIQQVY